MSEFRNHIASHFQKGVVEANPVVSGDDSHHAGIEVDVETVHRVVDVNKVLACKMSQLSSCFLATADDSHMLVERVGDLPKQSIRPIRKKYRCLVPKILVVVFDGLVEKFQLNIFESFLEKDNLLKRYALFL